MSYDALIQCYGRNNETHKALELFEDMKATIDSLVSCIILISPLNVIIGLQEMKKIFLVSKEAGFSPDRHDNYFRIISR